MDWVEKLKKSIDKPRLGELNTSKTEAECVLFCPFGDDIFANLHI